MSWNYRVFQKDVNERTYYYIKEVYYDANHEIVSFTEDTETGYFESTDNLEQTHELMLQDIKKYKQKPLKESDYDFN